VSFSPLSAGYSIGRFTIKEQLSLSDVAISYRAVDDSSSQFVIKEYFPKQLSHRDPSGKIIPNNDIDAKEFIDGQQQFNETGKCLAEIDHKNIVKVIDVIAQAGTSYFVMEYREGATLAEILEQSPILESDDIKLFLFPILEGLKELHKKNIFHLAIRPESIFISSDGNHQLIGFGSIYKRLSKGGASVFISNHGYAPIEQYTAHEELIGPWTDIYAIGALLFRCISGKELPKSSLRYEALEKTGSDLIGKAMDIGKGKYSIQMLSSIDHALKLVPNDRPKTISEWTQEFLALSVDKFTSLDDQVVEKEEVITQTIEEIFDHGGQIIEDSSDRIKLFRAYLGGKKQSYYMGQLLKQEDVGFSPRFSWNWGAFLFSVLWVFYRKMFLFGVIGLPAISIIIAYFVFYLVENYVQYEWYYFISPTIDYSISAYIIILTLLTGIFGNYIYYLHLRLKIRSIRKKFPDITNKRKQLSKIGGTSPSISFITLIVICASTYFGYKQLDIRDKIAQDQIGEAIGALNYTKDKIVKFKQENNRWPEQSDKLISHLTIDQYKYIADIQIIKQLLVVTFKDFDVLPGLAGNSIAYMGYETQSNPPRILWKCGSLGVPLEHLPNWCKSKLK